MSSETNQTNSGKNKPQNHRTSMHHLCLLKSQKHKFLEEGRSLQGNDCIGLFRSQIHRAPAKGDWRSRIVDSKVLYFDHFYDKSELNITQLQYLQHKCHQASGLYCTTVHVIQHITPWYLTARSLKLLESKRYKDLEFIL